MSATGIEAQAAEAEEPSFSRNWFRQSEPAWRALFATLRPRPVRILEIGAFEGRATCFMLEHVLAPDAPGEIHCVDTWEGGVEHAGIAMAAVHDRFQRNTAIMLRRFPQHRVITHRTRSFDAMIALLADGQAGSFDFVYVDGSHQAPDVLEDLVLGFRLCRAGGLVICDDYLWQRQKPGREDVLDTPKIAIDSFTNIFRRRLVFEPRSSRYQQAFRKTVA